MQYSIIGTWYGVWILRRSRSPACSPYERIHGRDHDRTASIAIKPIQRIPLIIRNLRIHFVNPAHSIHTWIHLQHANGIQEVVGSIPIGSTRSFNPPPPGRLLSYLVPPPWISPSVARGQRPRPPTEMIGCHCANHPPSSTPFGLCHNRSLRRDRSRSAPPRLVLGRRTRT